MSLHQPVPFEYRNGKLVDAFGNNVFWRNKHNLKIISEYMDKDSNPDVGDTLDDVEDEKAKAYDEGCSEGRKLVISILEEHVNDIALLEKLRKQIEKETS